MKKVHQNVVLSLVQDVVNFLSPQPARVAEPMTVTSQQELFREVENSEYEAAIQEAVEDQEMYDTAARAAEIKALKVPIVSDGDWLSNTLPSGALSSMLGEVKTQESPRKHPWRQHLDC